MNKDILNFSLAWRWTQESHNVFPDSILEQLQPLDADTASQLNEQHLSCFDGFYLNRELFSSIQSVDNEGSFSTFLTELDIEDITPIYLSWNADTALKTTWGIFRQYWDDFCYPASDDVTISPENMEWLLFYFHEDIFEFGIGKRKII